MMRLFEIMPLKSEIEKQRIDELETGLKFTGTQINYYFVCKRKLWLFSHNIELESESDLVHLGRLLHEQSYRRKFKEVQVDRIKVDFLERKPELPVNNGSESSFGGIGLSDSHGGCGQSGVVIHEVKRSKSMQEAHIFQLLYYMYYLKNTYGAKVSHGMLHYPLLKKNVPVELTSEQERRVEEVIRDVRKTVSAPNPPEAVWLRYCKSCAYSELCWG